MGDDWVDVGAEVYEDDEDEFEYLAPPDLDPDYLDEKDGDEVLWRPFSTVHDPPIAFDSINRRVFLPGQPIKVHIKEVERTGDGRLLNPYLYHIELKHADYEWTIVKRYKHFSNLHEALTLFRARMRIAVPTRTHRERRKSFARRRQTLPRFPRKPDALLRPDDLEQRRAQMELYLQNILRSPQFRNRHETLKFLEVSHLSFVLGLGPKLREGNVKKRSGGQRAVSKRCCGCFQQLAQNATAHWDTRWLVLKDTFVALVRPADGMVREVLLMDSEFEAMSGTASTGTREGIRITNLTRDLMMKCHSNQNAIHWKQCIMDVAATSGKQFTDGNRHGSFAPLRKDSYAAWFVDGAMYMNSVAESMEKAKDEIFITDWWLSPEIYMKRPITEGEYWRLDMILKRKAEQGVRIFIVIFKEMEMALGINSFYTKQALLKLHPTNIKVMRHPDGINFWSHHEKCVVIDQRIAFLGGIDLCYGRWDTPEHRLTDLGSINVASPGFEQGSEGFFKHLEKQTTQGVKAVLSKTRSGVENVMRASSWPTTVGDLLKGGSKDKHHHNLPPQQPYVEGGVEFVDTPSPAQVKKPLFPTPKLDAIDEQAGTEPDLDEVDYSEVKVESYPEHVEKVTKEEVLTESNKLKAASVIQGWGALTAKSKSSQNGSVEEEEEDAAAVAKRQRSHTESQTTEVHRTEVKTRSKTYTATTQVSSEMKIGTTTYSNETTKKWKIEDVHVTDGGQVELFIKKPDTLDLKTSSTTDSPDGSPKINGKAEGKLKYSYGSLNRASEDNDSDYSDAHSTLSEISDKGEEQAPYVDTGHINPLMVSSMGTSRSELDSQCTETETLSTLGSTPASPMKSLLGEDGLPCGQQETPAAKEDDALQRLQAKLKKAESKGEPSDSGKANLLSALSALSNKPSFNEGDQSSDTESSQATLPRQRTSTEDDMEIIYNPALEVIAMSPNTGLNTNILAGIASVALKAQEPEEPVVKEDPTIEKEKMQAALRMWTTAARQARAAPKDGKAAADGEQQDGEKKRNLRLKLRRMSRQKAMEGDGENGVVLDASRLQSPETPEFQQPWPSPKPSTPPARKRFSLQMSIIELPRQISQQIRGLWQRAASEVRAHTPSHSFLNRSNSSTPSGRSRTPKKLTYSPDAKQSPETISPLMPHRKKAKKAQEIKSDIRERFKRRKSKSLDVSVEDSQEEDPTVYRAFNDSITDPADNLDDLEGGSKIWIGKDYTNFIFKDFVDLDKPFTDFIDRTRTPRMPWHDIGAVVYGKPARDVARHFIQRWNFTKLEKRKTNLDYPLLLPKTYSKVTVPRRVLLSSIPCDVQMLRSSSSWSAGIQHTDSSIHQGYIDSILTSKHYIYIENQFFVTIDNHISLHNEIGGALFQRISRAHSYGEKFRVYVVMPLLPAFEGELGTGSGASIQAITHWNYNSISRGGKSLIERLIAHGVQDPTEYVTFYGLRTHTDLLGTLHSELVYVHSKLMIVDDEKVIIGSANINDRSMLGDRDSELAVLVEDTKFMPSRMNGEAYQAGWFASSLRKTLFREHLGVKKGTNTEVDVTDPVIDTFYKNQWIRTAAINTSVYDKVFRCLPTDHVRTFSQLHEYQKKEPLSRADPGMARTLLERVSGHLVFMPLMFLVEENLMPTVGTKEALVPTAIWT